LLPTATSLLSRLSNPLNITLLSSQLLENAALYPHPTTLLQARQIFSVFYTATLRFREDKRTLAQEQSRSQLNETEWITAVVKGASEQSPRWRHAIMIGALLLAGSERGEEPLSRPMRAKLELALVKAVNLSLQDPDHIEGHIGAVFVLNLTVQLLGEPVRLQLDFDALLPILIHATFFSHEGLDHGYWLSAIDEDVKATPEKRFRWSTQSRSYQRVQAIKSRPLVSGLGGLARLLAQSIDGVRNKQSILDAVLRLSEFARTLVTAWRQNKLSEVDINEEAQLLDDQTTRASLPVLLQMLREIMFTIIIALRSVVGCLLTDPFLASAINAPGIAIQTLHILRDTYFIAHRFGQTSSSQYVFVNFTALDLLNQYPRAAENYLAISRPNDPGKIPHHPLDRTSDLFFLNTAEHLTLTVSASSNDGLLAVAQPYIEARGDPRLGELYEAAHSVTLAVFAAPQNADLLPSHIPRYLETLLSSFPQPLNPRQFRLAIKSLVKLAGPPSLVANLMPHLQAIILDLLSHRMVIASEGPLPTMSDVPMESQQPLSEKAVLLLCIVESLQFLPPPLLHEWLPTAADLLYRINNKPQRALCQQKFWETLSNGDMDVDRAATCVTWWNHRGGREQVMLGEMPDELEEMTMSGALQQESKL
jgi:hypothetical protein